MPAVDCIERSGLYLRRYKHGIETGMEDNQTESAQSQRPIIVFDAMCVLCSANAQFVLNNDRRGYFLLASMQGAIGSAIYRKFGIDPTAPDTIVVVTGDIALRDSDAVLSIYEGLGWPWRILSIFKVSRASSVIPPIASKLAIATESSASVTSAGYRHQIRQGACSEPVASLCHRCISQLAR